MTDAHFINSTLRERIVEHIFVGDALRTLWRRKVLDVELLRSEFDAYGYDLVMACGDIVRHIQFKTGTTDRPARVPVYTSLSAKPSGCVLWIRISRDLDLGPYFWFGAAPGEKLPSLESFAVPRRPTHNAKGERPERRNHRVIPGSAFAKLLSMGQVLERLLGVPDLPKG